MPTPDNFKTALPVCQSDGKSKWKSDLRKRRKLLHSAKQLETMIRYCRWLNDKGIPFEVKLHRSGFYLVKSSGLNIKTIGQ